MYICHLYKIGLLLLLGFGQILNVYECKLTKFEYLFEFHFEYSDPGFEVGVIVNTWSTQNEYL